jgi:hypothetical protein
MGIFGNDLEQVRIGAGDAMALEHVRQRENSFGKPGIVLRVFDSDANERDDIFAQFPAIDPGGITGYDAFLFKLSHSLGHGWLRKADRRRHFQLSHPGALLQQMEQLIIYGIQGHFNKIIKVNVSSQL